MSPAVFGQEKERNQIAQAMSEVLASVSFRNSPQLSSFLKYVVERTLEGKGLSLKAYGIATEALGRPSSFDPVTDASVRVLASRVRSALQLHFLKGGSTSDLVIELLPGSYVPQFHPRMPPVQVPSRIAVDASGVVIRPSRFSHAGWIDQAVRNNAGRRLVILDDDSEIRAILHQIGVDAGYQVVDTANANEFWLAYGGFKPSHIFLDMLLPGSDGLEIMRELGLQSSKSRITLISGADRRLLRTSERLGKEFGLDIAACVGKPFEIEDIEKILLASNSAATQVSADALAHAIESSQILLHFQPKLSLLPGRGARVSGEEALVRWNHPVKGLIYPDAFISLAEDCGLIAALTYRVIDLAINQLGQWNEDNPELTMAINISGALLNDPSLAEQIAAKLDNAGIARRRLIIEITETSTAEQPAASIDAVTRLRLKGFELSIDDFGTGFSSLLRLLQMPFNEIKIDKHFVQESTKSSEARLIVETIIRLANSMNLRCCAEGVETQECLDLIRSLGCHSVQGYFFARPAPAEAFPNLLASLAKRQW